jgi:hypothetical protein
MKEQESTIDPLDPASLRIDPTARPEIGVKKPLVHVPVRKPSRQEYFRTRPEAEYRLPMAILTLSEEREAYAVSPAIAAALPREARNVELRTCISRSGTLFIWPVPLPKAVGRESAWHKTAREAAERAESVWIRIVANMGAGAYDIFEAPPGIPDAVWPEAPFKEMLRVAFGDGLLIDTLDHPVIKRLRGL